MDRYASGIIRHRKCVQTLIACTTLKLNFIGDDNVLNTILNQFGLSMSSSYTFLTEKNAPLRKDLHIETELDGTVCFYDGKENEARTRVDCY